MPVMADLTLGLRPHVPKGNRGVRVMPRSKAYLEDLSFLIPELDLDPWLSSMLRRWAVTLL